MASVLVHTADENVTLSARAARLLLEKGDGDAALLYLALLRHHGTVPPRSLAGELRWERSRIEAAEETLRQLGLIASDAPEKAAPLEPADERPVYQRSDIMERLEDSGEFRGLVAEVEKNGSGAKAGLRAGDVITHVNGARIYDFREYTKIIDKLPAGTSFEITVARYNDEKGEKLRKPIEVKLTVTLEMID